jgi:ribosomal protein S18 acetylase RimI-like enzyme
VSITLRQAEPQDRELLLTIYGSTRADELALTGWDEAAKQGFIEMQFALQAQYYYDVYPEADYLVILSDERPAGRLYLQRWEREIRIIDIAILPEFRNQGIGTGLLHDLFKEATEEGKRVSIHVEKLNPALRLYERLGFRPIEDKGVYLLMEWSFDSPRQ